MIEYLCKVKSVYVNDICIGFIARRNVVFGFDQSISNYWIAATNLLAPTWNGRFNTRKEAREWLEDQYKIRLRNASPIHSVASLAVGRSGQGFDADKQRWIDL